VGNKISDDLEMIQRMGLNMNGTKGIYIIGTDTDVGKTVVCAGLMYLLKSKGYDCCYFKPVSSAAGKRKTAFSLMMFLL